MRSPPGNQLAVIVVMALPSDEVCTSMEATLPKLDGAERLPGKHTQTPHACNPPVQSVWGGRNDDPVEGLSSDDGNLLPIKDEASSQSVVAVFLAFRNCTPNLFDKYSW